MSYIVHWLKNGEDFKLACGRPTSLRYLNGRLYETPLYAILDHGREGRWCRACLKIRRKLRK